MFINNKKMHKYFSCILLFTYFFMIMKYSFANATNAYNEKIDSANEFAIDLLNNSKNSSVDNDGNIYWKGQVLFSSSSATGQKENDYVPENANTLNDDFDLINFGKQAHSTYLDAQKKAKPNGSERAYQIIKKSFETQQPDLYNDPFWENTDHIFSNLPKIAKDFASCSVSTELVSIGGANYHVPKYETCERLPAIDENFLIKHDYTVGVLKHHSGAVNLASCGSGCMTMWIGTKQDNHWSGWCSIFEEKMSIKVLQPDKITYAKLSQSIFDDYHQVYLNNVKIYNAPNSLFPPETSGECELSTNWVTAPNINITNNFKEIEPNGIIEFKTKTSVSGNGEGYSQINVYYDAVNIVNQDVWNNDKAIEKAIEVKKQLADGFCTGKISCTNMPSLDKNKCRTENGIYVCESDFKTNPVAELGISPFCRTIEVQSNCAFNKGEICWKNLKGETVCFDNKTVNKNTCKEFETSSSCSYVKSECMQGMQGNSGKCYLQEDTFDCGFTVSTGLPVENEVLKCDGQIQCIGEACIVPKKDKPNDKFLEANAYLQILKHAKADMSCLNVPEKPFNIADPPDEYFPVATCPQGYSFDASNNECYQKINCEFDANNFYASSISNGIQAVFSGNILLQDKEVQSCIPLVQSSGITYTCGEVMQQEANDTFHEICANKTAKMQPKGCPSLSHVINKNNALCQIPPIPVCEEGYQLLQSSDPFGQNDFCQEICPKENLPCDKILAANYACPSSYPVLNQTEFRCETASPNPLVSLDLHAESKLTNSAKQIESTENDQTENVTCQLFQGKAQSCKLAVGGMQNCCEAPALPSLADYITLLATMLKVDALTAKLELIDGYSGTWQAVKIGLKKGWNSLQSTQSYQAIENGFSTAWNAVKGAFSSAADTAAAKGAEVATTASMESLKQAIMQHTNQFLIETLGADVASMFFAETGGKVVASDGVMAAAKAVAYVYYAYMAYIAFTVLVDIVYECSEEELDLSMKRELLSTYYIGSYCKNDELGVCIEKVNSYCVFSSPFSRIMMEQIYLQPQMNLSWGTAEKPNCSGVKFENIEKVDFAKLNLDEWIGILVKTNNIKALSSDLNLETLTGNGSFLNVTKEDRDNVLERNQKKLFEIDIDKVRRAAYEEAWNAGQTVN